jgi:hypothetical protein
MIKAVTAEAPFFLLLVVFLLSALHRHPEAYDRVMTAP